MLKLLKNLERFVANATDGEVGRIANFLFDDRLWAVRYLVVETGNFFDRRPVLISPRSVREADWSGLALELELSKAKVKAAPSIDTDLPVSRQHERAFNLFYGYPYYWEMRGTWGMAPSPALFPSTQHAAAEPSQRSSEPDGDVHLRSAQELRGYKIQGTDEEIGHIEDFIIDPETWEIRYLVIDTSNWWFGKKVLVAPRWASGIRWADKKVDMKLTREAIKNSPEWNGIDALNRSYEARLHGHYGQPPYWESDPKDKAGAPPRDNVIRP